MGPEETEGAGCLGGERAATAVEAVPDDRHRIPSRALDDVLLVDREPAELEGVVGGVTEWVEGVGQETEAGRVAVGKAGKDNGELDCWIDGKKCGEFRDINWRSTDALKVNKVQLSLWLDPASYTRTGGGTTRTVWYDDVVVATQYIGPKSE